MKKVLSLICFLLYIQLNSFAQNPIISSFFPTTTTICGGDNGDQITINGVFFGNQGANSDVSIGGNSCTIVSWSATQIICTAESGFSPYSGFVIVTNQSGNSSSGTIFKTVNPTPNNLISFTSSLFVLSNCGDSAMLITGGTNGNSRFFEGFCGGTEIGSGVVFKVSPTTTTTYFAANKSFVGGCISECRQVTIDVTSSCLTPTISSFPGTACIGSSITLNGSGFIGVNSILINGVNAPNFSVNSANSLTVTIPSNATSGTITINSPGGTATSGGSIAITPGINLTVSPDSPSICRGSSVTLQASGATTYSWSPQTGLSAGSGESVSANPSSTTTYQLTGNTGSCSGTKSVTVTLISPPVLTISPSGPIELCSEPVVLTATTGLTDYRWSNLAIGATIEVNEVGDYFVQAEDQNGCIGFSDTIEVISGLLPVAGFSYNQPGSSFLIEFSNLSQHADSYFWDFGQGDTSIQENPGFVFPIDGSFPVSLIAKNACGNDTVNLNVLIMGNEPGGINQISNSLQMLSPNPFQDHLQITLKGSDDSKATISVIDNLGKSVFREVIYRNEFDSKMINLSFLSKGLYSIHIVTSTKTMTKRVMKN